MADLRARPRWLQKLIANLGGYFWLPCPMCGKHFGGHEKGGHLYKGGGWGTMVCANCAEEAKKIGCDVQRNEWYYIRENNNV